MKKKRKRKTKEKFSSKVRRFFKNLSHSFFDDMDDDVNSKNTFSLAEVVLIVLISILFGIIVGYIITYTHSPVAGKKVNAKVSEIISTYNNIIDNYYEKVDEDKLADAAIKGMVDSLDDPYSNYMDSDISLTFNDTIDGFFTGIGVGVVFEDHYNKIEEVYADSPAFEAGLEVGDIITKVDGKSIKDIDSEGIVKLIRGKVGTKVKITIKRDGKEKEYTLKRDRVDLQSVYSTSFDYQDMKIGYIDINAFASNSFEQFETELKKLEKEGIDALVIDVRDNPGGHLQQTREILSLFFNKKQLLYQIQEKNEKQKVYAMNNKVRKYPIAILVDTNTASSAEIFSACFKDNYDKAVVVGTKTYGKGTVQKSQTLSSGSSIKYTTQKWLTSKGKWLDGKGVTPDINVEQSEEYYENPDDSNDQQLQEALKNLVEIK